LCCSVGVRAVWCYRYRPSGMIFSRGSHTLARLALALTKQPTNRPTTLLQPCLPPSSTSNSRTNSLNTSLIDHACGNANVCTTRHAIPPRMAVCTHTCSRALLHACERAASRVAGPLPLFLCFCSCCRPSESCSPPSHPQSQPECPQNPCYRGV
jgi:hypothetical protein